MPTKATILEAHVQYELNRYTRKNLKATLHEEIGVGLGWLEQVKLNDVLKPPQVLKFIKRNVIELPLPEEFTAFFKESVISVYEFLQKDQTSVDAILPKQIFDQIIENLVALQTLRHEITHQLVASSVYSMLISNVLYHGIKGFVLTENALVKNIPGASSFVKFGQKALNAASPKIEKNIDKQLIAFINGNIEETIEESEAFLNHSLDAKLIRKLGDEIWAANASKKMAALTGYVDADTLGTISELVQDFWLQYRTTPLFYNSARVVVQRLFLKYGKKDLRSCLEAMGITAELILQEAYEFALPFSEKALQSGDLENRIRTRLDGFYSAYYAQQEA